MEGWGAISAGRSHTNYSSYAFVFGAFNINMSHGLLPEESWFIVHRYRCRDHYERNKMHSLHFVTLLVACHVTLVQDIFTSCVFAYVSVTLSNQFRKKNSYNSEIQ